MAALAAAVFLCGSNAAAAIITYDFEGAISSGGMGTVDFGDTFSGRISWDTEGAQTLANSGTGWTNYRYDALTEFSIQVGGFQASLTNTAALPAIFGVQNGTPASMGTPDVFQVVVRSDRGGIAGTGEPGFGPARLLQFFFQQPDYSALASSDIPLSLDPGAYASPELYLEFWETPEMARVVQVGGVVSSFTAVPVPEPASWALLIGGFGVAGASIRRRRASAS